jgi:hypothetical protein
MGYRNLGEADPGGFGGVPPKNPIKILLFLVKEAKSVVMLRRRFVDPKLGEADPGGGLGGVPPKNPINIFLLFLEKM